MFHAQISWNKKRVKPDAEKNPAASVPNTKDRLTYIIRLEDGFKDDQTTK